MQDDMKWVSKYAETITASGTAPTASGASVLGSKRSPNAKTYDLLPVSWARSRMLRCTICCGSSARKRVSLSKM